MKKDILSTAVISTPEELKKAFNKDPWEVLIEVRPAARTKEPNNPDLVAILFTDNEIPYVGWQMKGALSILFGCDYSPTICKNDLIGNGKESGSVASDQSPLVNSLGMEFVPIFPGTFMMGSPKSEEGRYDDEFQHKVTLTKGFYMQTTQVTQGQWLAVMGNNPSKFKDCGDNCPVERVSWNDAQDFIQKLNVKEGTDKYCLPTEAEWEYACRAGSTTPFSFGSTLSTDQANYNGNFPYVGNPKGIYREKTTPVKSFSPNAWGLYDMHGNVWEWCQDWYDKDYYRNSPPTDPKGLSSGSYRVLRGGSWFIYGCFVRSADRLRDVPTASGTCRPNATSTAVCGLPEVRR